MADISAIFFILLIIGIAFPAMLTAWWLLFPAVISRAQTRVDKTPMRTFSMELAIVIVVTIPIVILLALPFGPAKFIGWILLAALLALSSIGSAGIAAHLGARLTSQSNLSPLMDSFAVPSSSNSLPSSLSLAGSSSGHFFSS